MIFDTHAHYDDHAYDEDREAVLASLSVHNVRRVVNVAADAASLFTTRDLAYAYDFVYGALGIHPDGVKEMTDETVDMIRRMVGEDRASGKRKIVAVGEVGLDYCGRDDIPREVQIPAFEKQLALSRELDLPVIVHSRDAAKDTYEILKAHKTGDGAGIVHCFSYEKEMARAFLDLGYYIALGGVVTFKNARKAKEVAAFVPLDRLLLETDCPYMAPVPLRGTRNDSRNLSHVVREIASLRGISEEEVEAHTFSNANRLYRICDGD